MRLHRSASCAAASILLAAIGVVGCSAGDEVRFPGPHDVGGPGTRGCDRSEEHGLFTIESSAERASLSGNYMDQPLPQRLGLVRSEGDCALFAVDPTVCPDWCLGMGICEATGECSAWPETIDVGTLDVIGTTPELSLRANDTGGYLSDEYPVLYRDGAEITISADGGASGEAPFALTVLGVPVLTSPHASSIPGAPGTLDQVPGEDMVVTWDPVEVPPGTRVVLSLPGDHHGDPSELQCMVEERVSRIVVPAALLDEFIAVSGSSENGGLRRVNSAHVDTERGCVAFASESRVPVDIEWSPRN